jgi:hypothetical protein
MVPRSRGSDGRAPGFVVPGESMLRVHMLLTESFLLIPS